MKGYKAFNKGLICRDKQYAENTVFKESKAIMCKKGMHFCKDPLSVLNYYPLVNDNGEMSEFAEVEALDEPITDDNEKFCSKELKIGTRLNLDSFINASIDFLKENCKGEKGISNEEYSQLVASGDDSKLVASGDDSKLVASGDFSKLVASGDDSKLAASGDFSKLVASGYNSQLATSGDNSQLVASGDDSKLAASGDDSKLVASGDDSKLAASGDFSKLVASGYNSVIMCAGAGSIAKGKIGSWITLAEWKRVSGEYIPVCVKTEKIDGIRIKEDTFYELVNGKFEEYKNER